MNEWYDSLAPGRGTIRPPAYSLLRTIFTTAASERPYPLIPYNPAHIRGAGNVKRLRKVQPASLQELEKIVDELPSRYNLMALLAAWCAMRFGELIVGLPKSDAGIRNLAIPPHLVPLVQGHLDNFAGAGKDALLFPAADNTGQHMAPSTL